MENATPCIHHEAMQKDIRWLIKIGYGVFLSGLAVITVGLYSIFYAGGLTEKVTTLERRMDRVEHAVYYGRNTR